jgi:hypothetical protein
VGCFDRAAGRAGGRRGEQSGPSNTESGLLGLHARFGQPERGPALSSLQRPRHRTNSRDDHAHTIKIMIDPG